MTSNWRRVSSRPGELGSFWLICGSDSSKTTGDFEDFFFMQKETRNKKSDVDLTIFGIK